MGAVGNACCAFSKERWTCSCVHGDGSFHRRHASFVTIARELGHFVESTIFDLRGERQGQTCASARWTVRDIQWEVALRAPVQG